jgi:hypothetical protein
MFVRFSCTNCAETSVDCQGATTSAHHTAADTWRTAKPVRCDGCDPVRPFRPMASSDVRLIELFEHVIIAFELACVLAVRQQRGKIHDSACCWLTKPKKRSFPNLCKSRTKAALLTDMHSILIGSQPQCCCSTRAHTIKMRQDHEKNMAPVFRVHNLSQRPFAAGWGALAAQHTRACCRH